VRSSPRLALGLGLIAATAALAAPALADEAPRTKLVMSETATREVEQDTLVAILSARGEAAAPREAQATVNSAMTAAIKKARAVASIRAATGGYRVYQERDNEGHPGAWIAEQDLSLTGQEAAALLDGLLLRGLTYQLSAEARRQVEDQLAIEAIGALRRRAEQVAGSMAMRVLAIETLRVGEAPGEPPVRPMFRAAVAEAAPAPPPAALPDLETVSANVQAELVLAPR
jgi:predicted secreted protein